MNCAVSTHKIQERDNFFTLSEGTDLLLTINWFI